MLAVCIAVTGPGCWGIPERGHCSQLGESGKFILEEVALRGFETRVGVSRPAGEGPVCSAEEGQLL